MGKVRLVGSDPELLIQTLLIDLALVSFLSIDAFIAFILIYWSSMWPTVRERLFVCSQSRLRAQVDPTPEEWIDFTVGKTLIQDPDTAHEVNLRGLIPRQNRSKRRSVEYAELPDFARESTRCLFGAQFGEELGEVDLKKNSPSIAGP